MRMEAMKRSYKIAAITTLCLGIWLAGCSDENGIEDILPDLVPAVSMLDFGQVNIDTVSVLSVTIRNLSSENITVERVTATDPAFLVGGYATGNELIPLALPFIVQANDSNKIYVGFSPTEAKSYTGTLVIESIDQAGNADKDLVDLKGIGLPDTN